MLIYRNANLSKSRGFTLIELSIVLVIIGLIVGGVLVGRDLISAAEIRAQISQIDKYQLAVNSFKLKYGYLPGDIPEPHASGFGFVTRGASPGQGDGNGYLTAFDPNSSSECARVMFGEAGMFWRDLSTAGMIDASLNTATPSQSYSSIVGANLDLYVPKAKIGGYVTAWSGGYRLFYLWEPLKADKSNYFTIEGLRGTDSSGCPRNVLPMTVSQAAAIDTKVDDGLPQFGKVLAFDSWYWAGWNGNYSTGSGMTYRSSGGASEGSVGGPIQAGVPVSAPASQYSCYDNGNVSAAVAQYTLAVNGGQGKNCSLSIQFQ